MDSLLFFPVAFGLSDCDFSFLMSQEYMAAHGSQGLFTQGAYNDPSQDDASQNHFGVSNANPLQSQVSLYNNYNEIGSKH